MTSQSKTSSPFIMIAFDADDTLWHNETFFSDTQAQFKNLLNKYHDHEIIEKKLYDVEIRNLEHFGYGVKGFTLSMIETAIELTEGRILGKEIQTIIDYGKSMLKAPVELLPDVKSVISQLSQEIPIMIITKGDLFDQESKVARSGIADFFTHVEILSQKKKADYETILNKYNIPPQQFLMVGNSLASDILPIIELGGHAVHIPYHTTWAHEVVEKKNDVKDKHITLESMGQFLEWFHNQ